MKIPEWLKPALYGAAAGAVALAIVGFSWGGWVTGGTAKQMAANQARCEDVAALVPICVEQSKQDPQVVDTRGGDKLCHSGDRWTSGTISTNFDVIWGVSVKIFLNELSR